MTDGQDLMRQIASAGARMDPALSERDVERLVTGARRRGRRRLLRRASLGAALAGSVVLALVVAGHVDESSVPVVQVPRARPSKPSARDRIVRLLDGSTATPLDASSEIAVADQAPDHVGLTLARGRGRFDVTANPARSFIVRAGGVTVTVVGTVFTVERVADRVGITVERGKVRVDWGVGTALLAEGEAGWYPPLVVSTEVADAPVPARAARKPAAPSSAPSRSPSPIRETAEQLLLEADRERLAGHPEAGIELLRKLLREHHADTRAPLAAFTLGRMLLIELGRPAEAATAFAEVRKLAPGGPFAEDALAREVEAWNQAGQAANARARAQEYLRSYPGGRRAAAVRAVSEAE